MKVLLINGSPNEFGCTYTALTEAQTVFEKNGIETEIVYLGKKPVAGCIACGMCVKACENDAIKLENNVAIIDPNKCTNCGKCKDACKRKAII